MKHKSVLKRLEERRKAYDSMPIDWKDARKRPGSMSGRK